MPPHKKVPFSNKQKKEQLKAKKQRKQNRANDDSDDDDDDDGRSCRSAARSRDRSNTRRSDKKQDVQVNKLNEQPIESTATRYDPNRYKLHFQTDNKQTAKKRNALARQPFNMLPKEALEIDVEACYDPDLSCVVQAKSTSPTIGNNMADEPQSAKTTSKSFKLDMPKRPPWDYCMSAQQLNDREQRYFKDYVEKVMSSAEESGRELSYFELNLETWRQLWRVIEMSDLILLIADIRFPALYFSPSLYHHVTTELHKNMILILNKIDLAPAPLVTAWINYFQFKFPQLRVVCFTSFPLEEQDIRGNDAVLQKERKKRRNFTPAVGPKQLLKACQELVGSKVNLSGWKDKIEEDSRDTKECTADNDVEVERVGEMKEEVMNTDYEQHEMYKDGILTIGCCGYPNVGKSSLINGLMGKKVVSVSRTPGHTKHFQTIFLTSNVKLCDSPGLVFPSYICRPLQILCGMYPVAQVRDPYSALRYLAERVDLPQLLKLKHPCIEDVSKDRTAASAAAGLQWSAIYICDAWAEKRGFVTAKAARNDVYRAANHLLRLATQGRICLCLAPPQFTERKDEWERSEATEEIRSLQALHRETSHLSDDESLSTDDDDEAESNDNETDEDDDDDDDKDRPHISNKFALLTTEND